MDSTLDLSDEQIDEAAFRRAWRDVFGTEPRRLPADLDAARAGEEAPAPEPAPKRRRKAVGA